MLFFFFCFFNDTATTEIYTLSLHDALPISATEEAAFALASPAAGCGCCSRRHRGPRPQLHGRRDPRDHRPAGRRYGHRSEEHTSELQSRQYLVCRLLLEKKKKKYNTISKIV